MTALNEDSNNDSIINIIYNDVNNSRADIYDRPGSVCIIDRYENRVSEDAKNNPNNLPVLIYRYKFTDDFMEELFQFAKIHQFDSRQDFKEAWANWIEENDEIVEQETDRLIGLGFEGDILNKMFKSARYYFRKKSPEKKEPKSRRQYMNVPKELLDNMDFHIESNIYNDDYKPKTGFISFCQDNEKVLKDTISKLLEQGIKDTQMIQDKIKKTYKNRYFMLTKNSNTTK
jgi:hypothetical protein